MSPNVVGERFRNAISFDVDDREAILRQMIEDALAAAPPPDLRDAIVATYFLAVRSRSLLDEADEIAYHATSGSHHPERGSLVAACTGWSAGAVPFDETGRVGLLHMAFPLRMLLQPDGHLTTTDVLHTAAGAAIFDLYDTQDVRLVRLTIPDEVLRTFPGPAHGPAGFRRLVGLADGEPAFGTILKPTAGLVPDDVGSLIGQIAQVPLLSFVKEDEDLYPNLPYSPVAERTRRALMAIEHERPRGAATLLFAPHVTAAPGEILATVDRVLEAGARAVMFSESWALGTVRLVREHTAGRPVPPAIYGHNAGIGVRTRGIWREVIDLLARLDGIDFRQTAPLRPGRPHLRPFGAEWRASENALTQPLPGIGATTIVRAGALDQGNIGLNLQDVEERGLSGAVLFLAGSAITAIEDEAGRPDPGLGAAAMGEAIDLHRSGELRTTPAEDHPRVLLEIARGRGLTALARALPQRYPELA